METQKVQKSCRPKRICMVVYSHYETDGRVRRYAETLAERGDHVDVIALKRSLDEPGQAKVEGVNLHNIQARVGKGERSRLGFLLPVLRFLVAAIGWVAWRHSRRPYDIFHIHNMPDFLIFAAGLPKLTGSRIILDIHDLVPEFYGNKFRAENGAHLARALRWMERICAKMADRIIVSNDLWLERFAKRTEAEGKCSVFLNHVDNRIFYQLPRRPEDGRAIVLYPGGLQWHQGLDIALRAFKRLGRNLPHAEFHIYGDGIAKPDLIRLTDELGLEGKVRFFPPVRVSEVAAIMAGADLGVVPKRADSFGDEAYSTKIMEFMSVGVPLVVSKTKIDQYYFDDSLVRFFHSGNAEAMAEAMEEVLTNKALRESLVQNGLAYAREHCWRTRKGDYLDLLDGLIEEEARSLQGRPQTHWQS